MALTAGTGSDGWQTATTSAEAIYNDSSRPLRMIYVTAKSDNADIALVKVSSVNTDGKYMPVPPGKTIYIPAPRGTGIVNVMAKMASGTGSIGWGVSV